MKKLAFARKVERVEAKHGMFWRYINEHHDAGPLYQCEKCTGFLPCFFLR